MDTIYRYISATIILLMSSIVISAQVSETQIKALIEQDYLSALTGLQELSSELSTISDASIRSEVRQAKKSLIDDYTTGGYSLFAAGAQIESGYSKKRKAYIESSPKSYLSSYTAPSTPLMIKVTGILKVPSSKWYKVSYTSKGEVGNNSEKREAIVAAEGAKLIIRRISYADRSKGQNYASNVNTKSSSKIKNQKLTASKPKVVSIPMPSFGTIATHQSDMGIDMEGQIQQPYPSAQLDALIDGVSISHVTLNRSTGKYHIHIPSEMITSQSMEIELRYEYADGKYIKSRKNIVIVDRQEESSIAGSHDGE